MTRIFFDVETTGLSPLKNSIHQLSGIVDIEGLEFDRFDIRMRPHPKAIIEESALNVCGVTKDQIMEYPPYEEGFMEFMSILRKHIDPYDKNTRAWLVGYNNRRFDDLFLETLFRLNNTEPMAWFWPDSHDVMCMVSVLLMEQRATMPSFKLGTVAKTFGISVDDNRLHDSLYDVNVTRDLYYEILTKS